MENRVGHLIVILRERAGLSQKELARAARVPRSWLSVVEIGRVAVPNRNRLIRIANALAVEPDVLLTISGQSRVVIPPPPEPTPLEQARRLVSLLERTLEHRPLPPETESPIAASSSESGSHVEPEYWPTETPDERRRQFVIRVKGDCLDTRIKPGERVVIDKDGTPTPDDVVAVEIDGEYLLKVVEQRDGDLWLVAYRHHDPVRFDESVNIVGVVSGVIRKP